MPSNAMKISQHIAHLQAQLEAVGDIDCVFVAGGELIALDTRMISPAADLLGRTLNAPVLVYGMMSDNGRLTSKPGNPYQADHEPGEWVYSRDVAPVTADTTAPVWVTVKRRNGVITRGYRLEDGRWFVSEGRFEAIEIVRDGVLAFKLLGAPE